MTHRRGGASQSAINNLLPPSECFLPGPAGLPSPQRASPCAEQERRAGVKEHFIAQHYERANALEHAAAQPTSDWHPDKPPVVGLCATRGGATLLGLKEKPINRPPSAASVTIKRFRTDVSLGFNQAAVCQQDVEDVKLLHRTGVL